MATDLIRRLFGKPDEPAKTFGPDRVTDMVRSIDRDFVQIDALHFFGHCVSSPMTATASPGRMARAGKMGL